MIRSNTSARVVNMQYFDDDVIPCEICQACVRRDQLSLHISLRHGRNLVPPPWEVPSRRNPLSSASPFPLPVFSASVGNNNNNTNMTPGRTDRSSAHESDPEVFVTSFEFHDPSPAEPAGQSRSQAQAQVQNSISNAISRMMLRNIINSAIGLEDGEDVYEVNLRIIEDAGGSVRRGVPDFEAVTRTLDRERDAGEITETLREGNTVCPICHCSFDDHPSSGEGSIPMQSQSQQQQQGRGVTMRKTMCRHVFCDSCIRHWLSMSCKCPVCMTHLPDLAATINRPSPNHPASQPSPSSSSSSLPRPSENTTGISPSAHSSYSEALSRGRYTQVM